MTAMNETFIVFRAEFGFLVYDPNDGSTKYTQHVPAATEAAGEDWAANGVMEDATHFFLPSRRWASNMHAVLLAAGRPCDTCGARVPNTPPEAECPLCFQKDETQRALIQLGEARLVKLEIDSH